MKRSKKIFCAIMTALPILICYGTTATASDSAGFKIRLFNNAVNKQPLYYEITREKQTPLAGVLEPGDDQGKLIMINTESTSNSNAKVIIKNAGGQPVFDTQITYYKDTAEFYTNTLLLDASYHVGTNELSSIQTISFDIKN